jgi:hypothetical protein
MRPSNRRPAGRFDSDAFDKMVRDMRTEARDGEIARSRRNAERARRGTVRRPPACAPDPDYPLDTFDWDGAIGRLKALLTEMHGRPTRWPTSPPGRFKAFKLAEWFPGAAGADGYTPTITPLMMCVRRNVVPPFTADAWANCKKPELGPRLSAIGLHLNRPCRSRQAGPSWLLGQPICRPTWPAKCSRWKHDAASCRLRGAPTCRLRGLGVNGHTTGSRPRCVPVIPPFPNRFRASLSRFNSRF